MRPAPPPAPSLRQRVVIAFTERLALKTLAVVLAVVLWFVVAAREPTEEITSVRFAPVLDSALVLRNPPQTIRAQVLGRPNEILKLANTPLVIRRPIDRNAPDTLVLPLRTSDVEVPDGVEVIVRDVFPHALTLHFESTASRRVPVRSAIMVRAETGVSPVAVRFDPESVTVLGPRRVVSVLPFVSTVRDSIAIDTLPHLVDLDTARLGVSVRPAQVKATFVPRRP